jgi:hypothetical protein
MIIAAALSYVLIPIGLELKPIERCPTYNPRLADEGCPKGGGGGVPFPKGGTREPFKDFKFPIGNDDEEGCTGSGGGNCGEGEGQGGGNGTGSEGNVKGWDGLK